MAEPMSVDEDDEKTGVPPSGGATGRTSTDLVKAAEIAFAKLDIPMSDARKDQDGYPYEYNLYSQGDEDYKDHSPTGKLSIGSENSITLKSHDIKHFIATTNALKKSGSKVISLNLSGAEWQKKEFAAKMIIAATITGIDVRGNPFPLKELLEVDKRIADVIKFQERKTVAEKAAETYRGEPSEDRLDILGMKMAKTMEAYKKILMPLPSGDQVKIFECGIEAVTDEKIRERAKQTAQTMNLLGGRGRRGGRGGR